MSADATITGGVVLAVFVGLVLERLTPEFIVLGGVAVLLVAGVITPQEAFGGFANPGVVALAAILIVAAALRETGALDGPSRRILGPARTLPAVRRRLTGVTACLSAFMNNTPVVALLMPVASDWARRRGQNPRGLLLPLSYAAVLGGTCTVLGTSTHFVVHGLLIEHGLKGLGVFELLPIGGPVALTGLLLVWLLAGRLLDAPGPTGAPTTRGGRREYTADLRVSNGAAFIGQSVEGAGLRQLPGLFLVAIERPRRRISPVDPGERLEAGDRLIFAGVLDTIVDLQRRRGLEAAEPLEDAEWVLHEAVVSRGSPLSGKTVREANFRGAYNAAVIAVHRAGERVVAKIGDIALRPGDTLLLQAAPGFARTFRDSTDFYLVSEVEQSARPRHNRMPLAVALMAAVVLSAALGLLPLAAAAVAGAVLAVSTGCISPGAARTAIDGSLLLVIGGSLGLAHALEKSGLAGALAGPLVHVAAAYGPAALLAAVYATAMCLTELITNTAAAALLFPTALAVAAAAGQDPRPFALAVTIGASISLATPLGYHTNMMVYGPGGYRVTDFLKVGLPIQIATGAVAVTMLSLIYGFV